MASASVEIVRQGTALLSERNWDEAFDLYDPDVK